MRDPFTDKRFANCICDQDHHDRKCPAIKTGKCHYKSLYNKRYDDEPKYRKRGQHIITFDDSSLVMLRSSLNALSLLCRTDNDKWWRDPKTKKRLKRNHGELFMLMVSEIAEAMEGHRKDLNDDKLPHRKMVEVELADCLIRIFDYAGEHQLDLGGAFMEKRQYNSVREDHSFAARLRKHGKKF